MERASQVVFAAIATCVCLFFGGYDVILFVGALLSGMGLFFPFLRLVGAIGFVISLTLGVGVALPPGWDLVLVTLGCWLVRLALSGPVRGEPLSVCVLGFAAVGVGGISREWMIVAAVAATMLSPVPFARTRRRSSTNLRLGYAAVVAALVAWAVIPPLVKTHQKTAILKAGDWAKFEVPLDQESQLNIAAMYSYSELKSLLSAEATSFGSLDSGYSEAWLITPTQVPSDADVVRLKNWVEKGGHLIVCTDHTDLFGHGRASNAILRHFGMQTSLTAFFPERAEEPAESTSSKSVRLKTANTQTGLFSWPLITACWWEERADYSTPNFFGGLQPSSDDSLHRRAITIRKSIGQGQVTVFGDSTVFANFAIFQPGTPELIEQLRERNAWYRVVAGIAALLPIALFLGIRGYEGSISALGLLGFVTLAQVPGAPLNWGSFVWWSGEKEFVFEHGQPDKRMATAYATFVLGGAKPRWTDNPIAGVEGIWVSTKKPPSSKWRWLEMNESSNDFVSEPSGVRSLLDAVTKAAPRTMSWQSVESNHVKVGNLWTDSSLGDWWFDRGIGAGRLQRITSWLAWVRRSPGFQEPSSTNVELKQASTAYWLIINGAEEREITLPEIVFEPNQEVHLGRGVWAKMLTTDGQQVILGGKGYTEGIGAPNDWVLVKKE